MKIKIILFLLFVTKIAVAQNGKDQLYLFDENWKPVEVAKAIYLLHVQQIADSSWQWDYYNLYGPMLKTEHYKDKDGEILHGEVDYYTKGILDSGGFYVNNKKDGDFWKFDSLKYKFKYVYRNDSLIETVDIAMEDKKKKMEDSVKKTKGIKEPEDEGTESEYPGGANGWSKYLRNNLKYPDRAVNGNFEGDVVIRFIIDKEGNVTDPKIVSSVEYSLDTEAMRIIKKSGKWTAAFQYGRKVKSYKQQPIQFRLR